MYAHTRPTFLSVIVKTPGASSLRCCDAKEDDQSSSLSCGAPRHTTPCDSNCEGSTVDAATGTLQDTLGGDLQQQQQQAGRGTSWGSMILSTHRRTCCWVPWRRSDGPCCRLGRQRSVQVDQTAEK